MAVQIMNNKNKLYLQWLSTANTNFDLQLDFHDSKRPSQISLEVIWLGEEMVAKMSVNIASFNQPHQKIPWLHINTPVKREVDGMLCFRKFFAEELVNNPHYKGGEEQEE